MPWEAVTKVVELTIYPSEPIAEGRVRVVKNQCIISVLHSISSFYQNVNDKLLVLR
jgi:hypothetical protein